jgi:hypothetical protein
MEFQEILFSAVNIYPGIPCEITKIQVYKLISLNRRQVWEVGVTVTTGRTANMTEARGDGFRCLATYHSLDEEKSKWDQTNSVKQFP